MKPKNMNMPGVRVRHEALEPLDGPPRDYASGVLSGYKSECPVCGKGLLLVGRDQTTLHLQRQDRCVNCGQVFLYEDIHEMRDFDEFGCLLPKEVHVARELREGV